MMKTFPSPILAVSGSVFLVFSAFLPSSSGGDAVTAFKAWFRDYKKCKIDLYQPSTVPRNDASNPSLRYVRTEAVQRMDALLDGLAARNDTAAARLLVEAASFRFHRRSEVEIRKYYKQQPWMLRAHALEALRRIDDPDALEWLELKLVKNEAGWGSPFRKIMALTVFGGEEKKGQHGLVLRLLEDRDPRVREKALSRLARIGDPADLEKIAALSNDREVRVRVAALEAIHSILQQRAKQNPAAAETGLDVATRCLEDPSWSVQEAALAIMEHFRSRRSIPVLMEHLERLAGRSGEARERVGQHTAAVLRSLTGAFILETDPAPWRRWWEENRENFVLSPAPKPELKRFQLDVPYFFNIPVDTDAVCFILDISGSMSAPLPGSGASEEPSRTKLDRAREELDRALSAMDPAVRFNIVLFNDEIRPFRPAPVPADRKNIAEAAAFYMKAEADGGTNFFDALNSVLHFQSMGLVDRFSDPQDFDTLFLLSDGVPTTGIVIDPEEIVRIISDANIHSRIRINTVYIGADSGRFMQALATKNFGTFVHVH